MRINNMLSAIVYTIGQTDYRYKIIWQKRKMS